MFAKPLATLAALAVAAPLALSIAGTAQAGSVDVDIYLGRPQVEIGGPRYIREVEGRGRGHGYHEDRGYGRGYGHGGGHEGRGGRHHRVCSPERAERKAWNLGLHRPWADVRGENVVVRGRVHGDRALVVFDRFSRNCRVLYTRGL